MNSKSPNLILETLAKEIRGGKYASSSQPFPSERALARRFGVSRVTITSALRELRGMGLLVALHGKGTFLTRSARKMCGKIGLILPGVAYSEFFQPVLAELSRLCQSKGIGLMFGGAFSPDGDLRAKQALDLAKDMVNERVSGVILQPIESLPNAPRINGRIASIFKEAGIPMVLLDSDIVPPPDRSAYDVVGINNFDAGRRLAVHLLAAGARRIVFATMPHPCYSIRNRLAGVYSVLSAHGEKLLGVWALSSTDVPAIRKAFRRDRPDAIICCCDTFAAYLKNSLEKAGKKFADGVMLAGFDDLQHASLITPKLTTIRQPCAEIAAQAFKALQERIAAPDAPPREILLHAPLVVRSSTRDAATRKNMKRRK